MGCPGCSCGKHDEVGTQVGEEFTGQSLPFNTMGTGSNATVTWSTSTVIKSPSLPEQLDNLISMANEIEARLDNILGMGEEVEPTEKPFGLSENVRALDKLLVKINSKTLEIYNKVGVL